MTGCRSAPSARSSGNACDAGWSNLTLQSGNYKAGNRGCFPGITLAVVVPR